MSAPESAQVQQQQVEAIVEAPAKEVKVDQKEEAVQPTVEPTVDQPKSVAAEAEALPENATDTQPLEESKPVAEATTPAEAPAIESPPEPTIEKRKHENINDPEVKKVKVGEE